MSKMSKRVALRLRRKKRIRGKVNGSNERPRLSVFRSARHISVQVIDDDAGATLVSINSFAQKGDGPRANIDRCTALGKELAAKCKEKNISQVVFDKNGYAYHGRVKALAEGAREGGLQF